MKQIDKRVSVVKKVKKTGKNSIQLPYTGIEHAIEAFRPDFITKYNDFEYIWYDR